MAKPTALGCYIFAGGFTLGMKKHFDVLAHFEDGDYGVSTFRAARPKIPVFTDIDAWPFDRFAPDVIYGNPPCAAWSPLGPRIQRGPDYWARDPRVDWVRAQFNLLELMRPKIWVWESVPSAFTRGRPLVDWFRERAYRLGYDVTFVLHNAMYLGAYQQRRRFFFVAHRIACPIEPEFGEPVTAGQCLRLFQDLHGKMEQYVHPINQPRWVVEALEPGQSLRGWQDANIERVRAEKIPRSSFAVRRAHPDKPMPATTGYDTIHPTEARYLSIEEMLFSAGYPVDYPLQGNLGGRGSLIARGVLPPVARWLGENLARAVRKNEAVSSEGVDRRTMLLDFSAPPGKIEREL